MSLSLVSPSLEVSDFDWVGPKADHDGSWPDVYELLATCYGGTRRGFVTRYDPLFLRERLAWGTGLRPPVQLGIASRTDGRLAAFVAAVPMPARYRGEPCTITGVNLWCVRPMFRNTRLGATLIRRLIAECSALGLADGALFTGRKLAYPRVGRRPNVVRVLDAARLAAVGLLDAFEHTPPLPEIPGRLRVRSAADTDPALLLDLFDAAHASSDVTLRLDSPEALRRFAVGPGLETWAIEDAVSGICIAWFSMYAKEIAAMSGATVRVACMWALGFRDATSARASVAAAIGIAAAGGHALIEFPNGVPLDDEGRLTLAVRPGPATILHTYGSAERYRGLTLDLPLF